MAIVYSITLYIAFGQGLPPVLVPSGTRGGIIDAQGAAWLMARAGAHELSIPG
jgi:hypothetical protein